MGKVLSFQRKGEVFPRHDNGREVTADELMQWFAENDIGLSLQFDDGNSVIMNQGKVTSLHGLVDHLISLGHLSVTRGGMHSHSVRVSQLSDDELVQVIEAWTPDKVEQNRDYYSLLVQTYRHRH